LPELAIMAGSGFSMPTHDQANPVKQEVEHQLDRMLGSDLFRARPQQAKVFEFIVRAALAGREIDEKDIRAEFFRTPPYKPESTVARTTVNFIRRELLAAYYESDGKNDPVIIGLPAFRETAQRCGRIKPPPGKAYKPAFAYNPRNPVDKHYRTGLFHLDQRSLNGDGFAKFRFDDVLKGNPDHAAAHLGLAEVFFRRALYRDMGIASREHLERAEGYVGSALLIDNASCNAWSLLGAIHCCRCHWAEAAEAFAQALKHDSAKTRYELWHYPAYLMTIGRAREALEMVRTRAANNPENAGARTIYGIFLYADRQFSEAFGELTEAAFANPQDWAAQLFIALVYLSEEYPTPRLEPTDWISRKIDKDLRHRKPTIALERAYAIVKPLDFPGLNLLCLVHARQLSRARKIIGRLERAAQNGELPSLDLALARMAVGENREALEALEQARPEHSPFLAWTHLWPLFDPLRDTPGFRALVKRMKLPAPAARRRPTT
jgi:Tfp pilus assembly protein PilF